MAEATGYVISAPMHVGLTMRTYCPIYRVTSYSGRVAYFFSQSCIWRGALLRECNAFVGCVNLVIAHCELLIYEPNNQPDMINMPTLHLPASCPFIFSEGWRINPSVDVPSPSGPFPSLAPFRCSTWIFGSPQLLCSITTHHKMQHRALPVLEYYLYFRASRGVRDPKPQSHTPSNTH